MRLSKLQRQILGLALVEHEKPPFVTIVGEPGVHGISTCFLVWSLYGITTGAAAHSARFDGDYSVRTSDRRVYNRAHAAISRSLKRLENHGLLRDLQREYVDPFEGTRRPNYSRCLLITDEGVAVTKRLSKQTIVNCLTDEHAVGGAL